MVSDNLAGAGGGPPKEHRLPSFRKIVAKVRRKGSSSAGQAQESSNETGTPNQTQESKGQLVRKKEVEATGQTERSSPDQDGNEARSTAQGGATNTVRAKLTHPTETESSHTAERQATQQSQEGISNTSETASIKITKGNMRTVTGERPADAPMKALSYADEGKSPKAAEKMSESTAQGAPAGSLGGQSPDGIERSVSETGKGQPTQATGDRSSSTPRPEMSGAIQLAPLQVPPKRQAPRGPEGPPSKVTVPGPSKPKLEASAQTTSGRHASNAKGKGIETIKQTTKTPPKSPQGVQANEAEEEAGNIANGETTGTSGAEAENTPEEDVTDVPLSSPARAPNPGPDTVIENGRDYVRWLIFDYEADKWERYESSITIDCEDDMEQLLVIGRLAEPVGVRACRRIVQAPVIGEELARALWNNLALRAASEDGLPEPPKMGKISEESWNLRIQQREGRALLEYATEREERKERKANEIEKTIKQWRKADKKKPKSLGPPSIPGMEVEDDWGGIIEWGIEPKEPIKIKITQFHDEEAQHQQQKSRGERSKAKAVRFSDVLGTQAEDVRRDSVDRGEGPSAPAKDKDVDRGEDVLQFQARVDIKGKGVDRGDGEQIQADIKGKGVDPGDQFRVPLDVKGKGVDRGDGEHKHGQVDIKGKGVDRGDGWLAQERNCRASSSTTSSVSSSPSSTSRDTPATQSDDTDHVYDTTTAAKTQTAAALNRSLTQSSDGNHVDDVGNKTPAGNAKTPAAADAKPSVKEESKLRKKSKAALDWIAKTMAAHGEGLAAGQGSTVPKYTPKPPRREDWG